MSIPDSSATNKTGLLVNLSEIITLEILSLSSFFNIDVKSLILLSIFLLDPFLSFCLIPRLDISTLPLEIDLKSYFLYLLIF